MAKTATSPQTSNEWQGAFAALNNVYKQISKNPAPALFFVAVYTVISITSLVIQGKTSYTDKGYVAYGDMIMLLFLLPLTVYGLAVADRKEMTVSEFMQLDIKKIFYLILVSILLGLILVGSFLLLIVPIIWTLAWFIMAVYPVVDKGMDPAQALKESKRLSKDHKKKVWGVVGVSILIEVGAAILTTVPYIGVAAAAFASVLTTALLAELYRWLQLQKS